MGEQHTPEPWGLRTVLHGAMNVKGLGIIQAETVPFTVTECIAFIDPEELVGDLQRANARRIVACVNACRGMETEMLEGVPESGLLVRWREASERQSIRERDEARAMVKELVEYIELTVDIVPGSFAHQLLIKAKEIPHV